MTNRLDERLDRIRRSRENRSKGSKLEYLKELNRKTLEALNVFTHIGILTVFALTISAGAFLLGSTQYDYSATTGLTDLENAENHGEVHTIDGYHIAVVDENYPAFERSNLSGFTYQYEDEKIFIKHAGREPAEIYQTCVHEKLHNLGMDGGDTYEHEMVYQYDSQVVDETCLKLLYRLNSAEGEQLSAH